jgi:hypothetical protein
MAPLPSTPTPVRCAHHRFPARRGRGKTETPAAFLSPRQGERWFAKQSGVGVPALAEYLGIA